MESAYAYKQVVDNYLQEELSLGIHLLIHWCRMVRSVDLE